jgi:hypothetical protein
MSKQSEERYSEAETVRRAETALKRMLSTPHKPHVPLGKGKKRNQTKTKKRG